MNLKALVLDLHSQVFGNRFAVPFHKRGINILDVVAVRTNDLSFEGFRLAVQDIELVVLTNVDLTDDSTFNEEGRLGRSGPETVSSKFGHPGAIVLR